MTNALANLLRGASRYMILITRSKIDWGTGSSRTPKIVLHETDHLDLVDKNEMDAELRRAKHIYVILTHADGGTCRIDLTHRYVEIWQDSAGIRSQITDFNDALLEGLAPRVATLSFSFFCFAWPPLMALIGFTIWTLSNPQIRHQIYATTDPVTNTPAWLNNYGAILIWIAWPLSALIGLIIMIIVVSSGCLRVWPRSLTIESGVQLISSIRTTIFTREVARSTTVAVIAAVVTVLVTLLFTRT